MRIDENLKVVVNDVKFWIILFFLIRLLGITNAPLETAHNWRQTTVAMVARNFFEVDNNILYPRIDIAGEKTGITGMEFPVLNYLIYLFSKVFGYSHWYGRLINLIVSSFGLFFFYKIVLKYFDKRIAFNAAIILLFSIWFSYSRKIMPDTFATSLIIIGVYYGSNFLEKSNFFSLLLYIIFIALGTLSKLPAAYLLVIFVVFFGSNKINIQLKVIFFFATITSLLLPTVWYFYWVPYLVDQFGFWHFFMGKNILIGLQEIINSLPNTLKRFYDDALKYIGFSIFIFGLIKMIGKQNKLLLTIFCLSFFSFLIVVFKAGFTFSHHTYYIIPFVPVMALVCGFGIYKIKNIKIRALVLISICLEGILNQQHDFRINKNELALLQLENDLNKVSEKKDLILINSGEYPTPMYFAHRKGWVNSNDQINDKNYVNQLNEKGLKYIVILKKTFEKNINLNYRVVFDSENYSIYKL